MIVAQYTISLLCMTFRTRTSFKSITISCVISGSFLSLVDHLTLLLSTGIIICEDYTLGAFQVHIEALSWLNTVTHTT